MTGKVGARDPALVNDAPAGHRPSGFDPARDGFPQSRLMWVLAHFSEKLAKDTAALTYGAWNPLYCASDASERAVATFNELREYLDHYAMQAAIAMEARQGGDACGSVHDSAAIAQGEGQ